MNFTSAVCKKNQSGKNTPALNIYTAIPLRTPTFQFKKRLIPLQEPQNWA